MPDLSDLRALEVILTARCNLRCSYCYQNARKARSIEWETLRASLDLILRSRRKSVNLLFIGGEPLLEFPLVRRAVAYVEGLRRRELKVHYDIFTNGILLADEHVRFFAAHGVDVQLSFDGVPAAQALRGKGTFAVLDRLIDRLRQGHREFFRRRVSVSLTLLPQTVPWLPDSVDYFLAKGVQTIVISPDVTGQSEWTTARIGELDSAFERVFQLCLDHLHKTGEVPLAAFRRNGRRASNQPVDVPMCAVASGRKAAIDADGEVVGCVALAQSYQVFPAGFLRSRLEPLRMGNVRDAGIRRRRANYPAAARASGLFTGKQHKYSSFGRCVECRYLTTCRICPVSIGLQPGNTDPARVPDFLCAYNLVSLKYRERFPAVPRMSDLLQKIRRSMREIDRLLPGDATTRSGTTRTHR